MELNHIFVTQRRLRNVAQLPDLSRDVGVSLRVPPVILGELDDGTIFIIDGHHRCVAYLLSGRTTLQFGEYILCQVETGRAMFGRLTDPKSIARLLGPEFSETAWPPAS